MTLISMPIRVVSEANQREHWAKKHGRKKAQQKEFLVHWKNHAKSKFSLPVKVRFTRCASRLLDSDNLAGSFKHVRDALAKILGVDDGSDSISFEYDQIKLKKREYYILVEVKEL